MNWKIKLENFRIIKQQLFNGQQTQPCYWCGYHLTYEISTIEHIKPVSMGGEDCLSNCKIACKKCNKKRGILTPEEFINNEWLIKKKKQIEAEERNKKKRETK